MNRKSTPEEIKDRIDGISAELKAEEYFKALQDADLQMKAHDPKDKVFYQHMQDEINLCHNRLMEYYYEVRGLLESYISIRTAQIYIEFELQDKITIDGKSLELKKIPSQDALDNLIKGEIPDASFAENFLKGRLRGAEQSLKTARNHTYTETKDSKLGGELDE